MATLLANIPEQNGTPEKLKVKNEDRLVGPEAFEEDYGIGCFVMEDLARVTIGKSSDVADNRDPQKMWCKTWGGGAGDEVKD